LSDFSENNPGKAPNTGFKRCGVQMKKENQIFYCLLLLMTTISMPNTLRGIDVDTFPNEQSLEDALLTIYTYESLLADPGYDFIEGFANYSGLSSDEIQLVKFSDANTIVTQATLEKDNPTADVLIGLDNILIHKAKTQDILVPYESPQLANISLDLINNLDPDHFLIPYDYGIIALWYDSARINETTNPGLDNLTLQDIIEEDLDKKLIVENPTLSSPGLGFLLWTIAVYGDPTIDLSGLLNQNWRDWWRETKDDLRITASWGDAYVEWANTEQDRPLMVSYGTSPAYSAVLYDYDGEKALVTHENNLDNAWLQIEGIGLVKNASHPEIAKNFIDWFLSTDLQDHIATNNWMYPAHLNASVDPIFAETSINPDEVDILNNLITPSMLSENIERWQEDWESIIAGEGIIISGYHLSFVFIAVIAVIGYKMQNKKVKF
jgi:thiamine transport system substrate-binding protein